MGQSERSARSTAAVITGPFHGCGSPIRESHAAERPADPVDIRAGHAESGTVRAGVPGVDSRPSPATRQA
ncbi:hypothetical protein GCM10022379_00210 [Micromonospora maritima]